MLKIKEAHDTEKCYKTMCLLQLNIHDHEIVYNLGEKNFYEVALLDDDESFRDPIKFSMTGFEHRTPDKSFVVNYSRSLGFMTPCKLVGRSGLVRAYSEIDLK